MNLGNATIESHQFIDQTTGLDTSGTAEFTFEIMGAGVPFKVSLVWSDFPSTEAAAVNLVNDLDLEVLSPPRTAYMGNMFNGGWSQSGGSPDRVNNVENVYVQTAEAGIGTVRVKGYNVPQTSQPYAMVINGNFVGSSHYLP